METDGSFLDANEDLERVVEPTDRRPDFAAETLSPGVRIGLLLSLLTAVGILIASLTAMALYPDGFLHFGNFFGVMIIGATFGLGFIMLLIFGALLGNNARLTRGERTMWYVMFGLAGPVALPAYWFLEVWPVPFEPSSRQIL